VLPELVKEGIGILGMKPMANGIILKSKTVSAIECLRYALSLPTSVVITGVDSMEILDQACEAARTFRPLSDAELTALLARTATAAARGDFEPFKTSSIFDSTAQKPGMARRRTAAPAGPHALSPHDCRPIPLRASPLIAASACAKEKPERWGFFSPAVRRGAHASSCARRGACFHAAAIESGRNMLVSNAGMRASSLPREHS